MGGGGEKPIGVGVVVVLIAGIEYRLQELVSFCVRGITCFETRSD